MSYTVTIIQTGEPSANTASGFVSPAVEVLRCTVEVIDLKNVFNAIHKKPRKPRERKVKVAP